MASDDDNKNTIAELASVHLGKAGDGSVVKPYQTPDSIDPTLLVGIPRYLNREQYEIEEDNLPFVGVDSWNGYEFSCLLDNGFPITGQLRWNYSSDSENIVESKSAKLYLNSFNMAKMGKTKKEAVDNICEQVYNDMSDAIKLKYSEDLQVHLHLHLDEAVTPVGYGYIQIDNIVDVENIKFTHYNEDVNILDVVDSTYSMYRYSSNSLRSNCRVTNQPDWGDVYIHIKGKKTITPESLIQYIVSMRKENHFHEEICECIYKRLWDILEPEELIVTCLYTRRGGLDINPIRASSKELLDQIPISKANILPIKTLRQ